VQRRRSLPSAALEASPSHEGQHGLVGRRDVAADEHLQQPCDRAEGLAGGRVATFLHQRSQLGNLLNELVVDPLVQPDHKHLANHDQ
jgi:hypothetical protein